jgi:hypothetical protein
MGEAVNLHAIRNSNFKLGQTNNQATQDKEKKEKGCCS